MANRWVSLGGGGGGCEGCCMAKCWVSLGGGGWEDC